MADFQEAYGLPGTLPPLRLPSDAELARQARASRLARDLAALTGWLGTDGKVVDHDGNLPKDAQEDARAALGVSPERLRVLWQYALTVDWVEVGPGDDAGTGDRAFPGETAEAWASGDAPGDQDAHNQEARDADTLDAWASVFAAVLSEAVCAAAGRPGHPDDAGRPGNHDDDTGHPGDIDVHVPGTAMALVGFLSRREGLSCEDARSLVREVMTGELPPEHAQRAWDGWVSAHGEPADVLLGQLAEAGAVTLPRTGDGTIRFTPLALREMRLQLIDEGVEVPLLPATAAELTATQLLALAEGIPNEEFEAEADAWLTAHGPRRSAGILLELAAAGTPAERLTAVSVVSRAGDAAEQAWRDNIGVPALRPYAKVALAGMTLGSALRTTGAPGPAATAGGLALLPGPVPPGMLPAELLPLPDDLAWLAIDVLSLACDDEDTDPQAIAAAFAQSVPPGEEANAIDMLWRAPHPDAGRVLSHLGRFHPDKKIAKEARRAVHKAAGRHGGKGL